MRSKAGDRSFSPHHAWAPTDRGDRRVKVALWACLFAGVVREVLGQTQLVSFGFYTLHVVDPAAVLAVIALSDNAARGRLRWGPWAWPILIMTAIVGLNFLRGMTGDSARALLWARANYGLLFVLPLALLARPSPTVFTALRSAFNWAAAVLGALILLRSALGPALFMTIDVAAGDVNDGGRALSAQGTLILVFAAAIRLSDLVRSGRVAIDARTLFTLALPPLVFLTLQGTAGVAMVAVLVATLMLEGRGLRSPSRIILTGSLFLLMALGIALLLALASDIIRLDQRSTNLGTRQQVWDALTSLWPGLPLGTQWFGFPADQAPTIYTFNRGEYSEWMNSMHSMYYGALPTMGYVGLACWVFVLLTVGYRALVGVLRVERPLPAFPFACCVATAILSYSYEVRGDQLLGLVIAILCARAVPMAQSREPSYRENSVRA